MRGGDAAPQIEKRPAHRWAAEALRMECIGERRQRRPPGGSPADALPTDAKRSGPAPWSTLKLHEETSIPRTHVGQFFRPRSPAEARRTQPPRTSPTRRNCAPSQTSTRAGWSADSTPVGRFPRPPELAAPLQDGCPCWLEFLLAPRATAESTDRLRLPPPGAERCCARR